MENENLKKHLRDYLQITCKMLVNSDDNVSVDYVSGDKTTVFHIHSSNVGAILGKKGRIIQAIREIIISAGHKYRIRCIVEISDDIRSEKFVVDGTPSQSKD